MAVAFLPELPGSQLAVEIAWGADLAADEATWVWADVTDDVRMDPGLSLALGRADEAATSQPATCSVLLDNTAGAYSLGPQSANYPNVRRNTPVRVRIDQGDSVWHVVFLGYATAWAPTWDLAGVERVVELAADGALRRIQQGASPTTSALRRYIPDNVTAVAYWPLEEEKHAVQGRPVLGSTPLTFEQETTVIPAEGKITFGGAEDMPASLRAPEVARGGRLIASLPPDGLTDGWAVTWGMRIDAATGGRVILEAGPDFTLTMLVFTDGTARASLVLTDPFNPTTVGQLTFAADDYDGVWHWYELYARPSAGGGDTFIYFYIDGALVGGAVEVGLTTPTLATVRFQSEFSSDDPAAFAHPIVSAYDDYAVTRGTLAYVATGHDGENPVTRLSRLCAEEGVPVTVTGTSSAAMGPQFPDTFLGLIRECEATEHGILYDGVGAGLAYVTRTERENRAVDLTVDVPAGDLAAEFAPVDDDQRNVNRAVAEQREGTAATYTDLDGPLGVATIGLYDTSLAVNAADADSVADYAGWAVHLGTVEGYRYPSVTADLRAAPGLAGGWLAAGPSSRITVADPGSALTGHPSGDVDLLVEGTVQEITPFRWSATAQCSPYNPWRIVVLAADLGDTDPHLCHLDTAAAELAAPAAAGASTLSVATTTGPAWTTATDDTPFVVEVGGVAVEVTAVVGAASPQTFTVTPATVTRALPAGAVVRVHRPTALAL